MLLWSVLLLTTLPASPPAEVEMRSIRVYDGHASIDVPADWHEMPTELLDFLSMRTTELSGGQITEYYQHGFRPAANDSGFELPQVLIQIQEIGRLSLSQFINLPSPDQVETQSVDLMTQQRGPFLRDVELDGISFDLDRRCLRVDSTLELLVEGMTAVRSASYLTERGVFVVHCYDHASRMETSAALFDRIIASVRFDDVVNYRVRRWDAWTSRHSATLLVLLAAGAGLSVIALRRKRRRPVAADTEESRR